MKLVWTLLRVFLFFFLPAFIVYICSDQGWLDKLKENEILGYNFDVLQAKRALLGIGIILSNFLLVVLYELKNNKSDSLKNKNLALMNQLKSSFLLGLGQLLGDQHTNSIKFRVFREQKNIRALLRRIKSWFKKEAFSRSLEVVNIDGLSDIDNTKGLCFEIYPRLQGLVAQCYTEGRTLFEEDISLLDDQYNLTPFQISKTRNIKFCLAVPIYNGDNNVVSIITLDCIYSIKIDEDANEVENMINVFVQDLNKFFPRLFK